MWLSEGARRAKWQKPIPPRLNIRRASFNGNAPASVQGAPRLVLLKCFAPSSSSGYSIWSLDGVQAARSLQTARPSSARPPLQSNSNFAVCIAPLQRYIRIALPILDIYHGSSQNYTRGKPRNEEPEAYALRRRQPDSGWPL